MKKAWENVKSCTRCHKLFDSVAGRNLCPACVKEEETAFTKVYKYIRQHKRAGIFEISEACHVPTRQIIDWVKQERLSFTKESEISLECEECGKPILTGRYCTLCKAKKLRTLQSFYVEKEDDDPLYPRNGNQSRVRFIRE